MGIELRRVFVITIFFFSFFKRLFSIYANLRTRDPRNLIGQIFSHEPDDVGAHAVPDQMQTLDAPRHVVRYPFQHRRDVFADVFGPHLRAGVRQIGRVLSPVHADHVVIAHV